MDDEELTLSLSPGSPDYLASGVVSGEHSFEEDSSGTITPVNVKIASSSDAKSESEEEPSSMIAGSLRGKTMFLTFAQCDQDPKETLDKIVSMWNVEYVVVAGELHKDGTPHLHAVVKLKKRETIPFLELD